MIKIDLMPKKGGERFLNGLGHICMAYPIYWVFVYDGWHMLKFRFDHTHFGAIIGGTTNCGRQNARKPTWKWA